MTQPTQGVYYDLHITGIGYLNRARAIPVPQGEPWLAVDIVALQGHSAKVRKTRFNCKVVSKNARTLVRRLMPRMALDQTVLAGFRLGDLAPKTFVYQKGERQGETGVSLKANLLHLAWVKVNGKKVDLDALLQPKLPRQDGIAA